MPASNRTVHRECGPSGEGRTTFFDRAHLLTWRNFLLTLIVLGVALRVVGLFSGTVASDASSYAVMAESLLENGEFVMPLGDWWSDNWAPAYSHHYSPAYPIYLAPFVAIGGLSPMTIKFAAFVSSLLMIAVAFWTTRSLYGASKAFLVAAAASVDPALIATGSAGYSEDFLTLFFVLTMWAILKSLRDERYMVLAGVFAGIAYLTKGVMGWFFLIAGLSGLAWRFHYIRWRVFKDKYYIAAILIFAAFVAAWSLRNLTRFWDGSAAGLLTAWQSSAYFARATDEAAANPLALAFILAVRLPFYVGLFLLLGIYWLKDFRRMTRITDEHYSGLWLAVFLTYFLAWLISGILWVHEGNPIFWVDQIRYVVMANVVILWLVVKDAKERDRGFRRKYSAMIAVLLVVGILFLAQPRPGTFAAYDILREQARDGDVVAIDGLLRYEVMVNVGTSLTYVAYAPGIRADFIITADSSKTFSGYTLLGIGRTLNSMPGFVLNSTVAVWEAT